MNYAPKKTNSSVEDRLSNINRNDALSIVLILLLSRGTILRNTEPVVFFFIDTAPTEIYTLSLHDALPISLFPVARRMPAFFHTGAIGWQQPPDPPLDRKSTRLNSSHEWISYAVFCLK